MGEAEGMVGTWELVPDLRSAPDRFGVRRLEISAEGGEVRILRMMPGGRSSDLLRFRTDGSSLDEPCRAGIVPDTVYLGVYRVPGGVRRLTGSAGASGRDLRVVEEMEVATSQGTRRASIEHRLSLDEEGAFLDYVASRSIGPERRENRSVFKRSGAKLAYVVEMGEDWSISGDLASHALIISLQGLANRRGPLLYLVYPQMWDYKFTPNILEFLKEKKGYAFARLGSASDALRALRAGVSGYVLWDKEVRTSLIVAFTIAGVENAVVATEDQEPLVRELGIPKTADLRGIFRGKPDAEIYRWAYERYWERTNRERIVWLGGEHGTITKPGVADWGIHQKAFFTDLSTRPTDRAEYELARTLLAAQKPGSLVFGWHSYKKDLEGEHVRLTSSFGLRMEGLHTLPNLSFMSHVELTPGFRFRNNHTVTHGDRPAPKDKVYIACVQTDCLGIGAWTEPGRGEIPYAWEVTMNWVWLSPVMMEFFYSQATPNDYFIGALGGPGYVYPKAVPPRLLPGLIAQAAELMRTLDLRIFDIADFSEGEFLDGNIDLPRSIVDAFYAGMPDAMGFVNGYGPAHTFTIKDGRPFLSFDYYLAPERTEEDAAADLRELAGLNAKRPYFLLVHVRNFSDIRRVKRILDRLPREEYEVVALDAFMAMAARKWTFAEWLREERP